MSSALAPSNAWVNPSEDAQVHTSVTWSGPFLPDRLSQIQAGHWARLESTSGHQATLAHPTAWGLATFDGVLGVYAFPSLE